MEEVTCPNCNVDVEREELKRNNLRCPTCGFDLSDAGEVVEPDAVDEDELDEDEDEEDEEDDEEEVRRVRSWPAFFVAALNDY